MTSGERRFLSRAPWLTLAAAAIAVAVAACGGSHKSSTTTKQKTTVAPKATHKAPKFIVEQAHGPGAKRFATSVSAHPGDLVAFRTVVPATVKTPQPVKLTFALGPSKTLKVTASTPQHTSTASIVSSSGSSVTLVHLHYVCAVAPAPSFCPAKHVTTGGGRSSVEFSTSHSSDIMVLGVVGPVSLPTPKTSPVGSSVVTPYKAIELVKVFPGGKTTGSLKTSPPTPTASAAPGDVVELLTRVASKLHGAPQAVTVTINQGPGSTITVSASAKGGASSSATIKGKSGSRIELVLPHYTCFLPPLPTFCPPARQQSGSHRYTLTFKSAPGMVPPVIIAKVQAG